MKEYIMLRMHRSLVDEISAVFIRACREHDYEVAEHLLQTLEAIAKRDGNAQLTEAAYSELARRCCALHSQ